MRKQDDTMDSSERGIRGVSSRARDASRKGAVVGRSTQVQQRQEASKGVAMFTRDERDEISRIADGIVREQIEAERRRAASTAFSATGIPKWKSCDASPGTQPFRDAQDRLNAEAKAKMESAKRRNIRNEVRELDRCIRDAYILHANTHHKAPRVLFVTRSDWQSIVANAELNQATVVPDDGRPQVYMNMRVQIMPDDYRLAVGMITEA